MKKRDLFIKISFILLLFSLVLIYLWIYVFPSIKRINVMKRDIRECSLRISNAHTEKALFVHRDKKELQLFRKVNKEFSRKLRISDISEGSFGSIMRKMGQKAGIIGLKILEVEDPGKGAAVDSSFEGFMGIKIKSTEFKFSAGFRYGAEFIRRFPDTGQYLLIKSIKAERSGLYYIFSVISEHHFISNNSRIGITGEEGQNDLIDMDSPFLKKPVYLSPVKLRAKHEDGPSE